MDVQTAVCGIKPLPSWAKASYTTFISLLLSTIVAWCSQEIAQEMFVELN